MKASERVKTPRTCCTLLFCNWPLWTDSVILPVWPPTFLVPTTSKLFPGPGKFTEHKWTIHGPSCAQISVNSSLLHPPGAEWQKTRDCDKRKLHPDSWSRGAIPPHLRFKAGDFANVWCPTAPLRIAFCGFLSEALDITASAATSGSIRKLVFVQIALWLLIWHSAHLCVCQVRHCAAIDWLRPGQSGWVCARQVISDITPWKSSVCLCFPLSIVWGVH